MTVLDLILAGLVIATLDIDVALYQSARVQRVEKNKQGPLIYWVLAVELLGRLAALALVLFVFTGPDEQLFKLFGVSLTPSGLMLLAAGAFLFFSSSVELGEFLGSADEGESTPTSKTASFQHLLIEMSAISLFMGVDSVVAIIAITDNLINGSVILLIATGIRWLAVQQFAAYMRRNPSFKYVTTTFLILVGITLILEGVQVDFPEEGFGLGILAAIIAQTVYKKVREKRLAQANRPKTNVTPDATKATDA